MTEDEIERLIEASSLGTPGARALRRRPSQEQLDWIEQHIAAAPPLSSEQVATLRRILQPYCSTSQPPPIPGHADDDRDR